MKAKKEENRTRVFTVPKEMIGRFFGYAEIHNLQTKLTDCDPPHDVILEVSYNREERPHVMKLIEMLDDFRNKWEAEPRELWME